MISEKRFKRNVFLHHLVLVCGLLSVVLYTLDIKKQKRDSIAFADALIAAQAGRWYLDLETDELRWDDQMFVLFGKSRKDWQPTYGGFEECLIPEDRLRVRRQVETAIANRGGYNDVFTVVRDNGEFVGIRAAGLVSRDGSYMTGLCLPVVVTLGNYDRSIGKVTEINATPTSATILRSAQATDPMIEKSPLEMFDTEVLGPPTRRTIEEAPYYSDSSSPFESDVIQRN